jgi:hypothetical protein
MCAVHVEWQNSVFCWKHLLLADNQLISIRNRHATWTRSRRKSRELSGLPLNSAALASGRRSWLLALKVHGSWRRKLGRL